MPAARFTRWEMGGPLFGGTGQFNEGNVTVSSNVSANGDMLILTVWRRTR